MLVVRHHGIARQCCLLREYHQDARPVRCPLGGTGDSAPLVVTPAMILESANVGLRHQALPAQAIRRRYVVDASVVPGRQV